MKCTVCHHPQRLEIDRALTAGVSVRLVSFRHGLSRSALARHQRNHLRGAAGPRPGGCAAPLTYPRRLRLARIRSDLLGLRETDPRPGRLLPLGQIIEETQELLEQLKIWWEAQGNRDFPASSGPGATGEANRPRLSHGPQAAEQERLAVGL